MKNNASLVYSFFLIIGDFLALVAAFITAYVLRVSLDDRPLAAQITSREYLRVFLFLLPFWLIIFGLLGLYNKNTYEKRFSELGRIITGSVVGILFVIGYGFFTGRAIFPARLVPVYGLALALFFIILLRTIARGIRRSLFSYGIGINNVLIIGDTPVTRELLRSLSDTKATGYRIIGLVGGQQQRLVEFQANRIFDSFAAAVHKLRNDQIHSIIQTELYPANEDNSEILTYAQEHHISYRFVPGNSELFVGNIDVDLFQSIPVIAVHQTALVGWGRIVKRLFDIFVGTFLLVLASPLMLLTAICLKLFDRGPIFFRQERLSRFNSRVSIYKFRSSKMAYNGLLPEEAFEKMGRPELAKHYRSNGDFLDNDPRFSALGRLIRATSIDELPQLMNVVKGDISLVGPRALVERDLEKYDKKNLILGVKSGMTGLAVISGRKNLPIEERRKLDVYYVQNWSFWGDIIIIARTFSIVLFHRGAK